MWDAKYKAQTHHPSSSRLQTESCSLNATQRFTKEGYGEEISGHIGEMMRSIIYLLLSQQGIRISH